MLNVTVISKDRHAEAQVILKRLHDDHHDHTFWEKEYIQISAQLEVERKEKETASWNHMVTNKQELKRLAIAVAALTSVQTNGAQTIQIYQVSDLLMNGWEFALVNAKKAVLYAGLGFDTKHQLLMAGVFGICNTAGGLTNLVLIDRVGRRKLFLLGLVILSVWLGVFAACSERYAATGLTSEVPHFPTLATDLTQFTGWGKAGVGFVMVFIYSFGTTFAASPYAYAAEILPTKIRANGMAVGLFFANAVTLTFTQVSPIALKEIAWKFNIVFIACNLFFLPIVYFFFPEVRDSAIGATQV
jgi:MFS family permease